MNSKRKINVLVDAHIFDQSFQGTATYLKGVYNSLVKNDNFQITICANNIENIKTHFADERFNFIKLRSKSKIKRLVIEIPKIIKLGDFDFAHFQYIAPPIKHCKFIITIHDLLFLDFKDSFPLSYRIKNRILFYYSSVRSDLLLTVSEYSRERISKHFGLNRNRIFVTPNAVDDKNPIHKVDIKEKYQLSKYILFVSRFEPRKNHIGLLRAFIQLKLYEKEYQLVFVGSKDEAIESKAFEFLKKQIPDSIQEHVKFFEKIPSQDLDYLYQEAECFIYPSKAEGFGIPPLEAAILETKVLCSNTTSMSDFDFLAYSFDPRDQDEFNHKLNDILDDKNYPSKQIRKAILDKYNWDIIATDFAELLLKNPQL